MTSYIYLLKLREQSFVCIVKSISNSLNWTSCFIKLPSINNIKNINESIWYSMQAYEIINRYPDNVNENLLLNTHKAEITKTALQNILAV